MATNERPDDARRTGDAVDRVIDDAVESALRVGPVDLRTQVLARLQEPVEPKPERRLRHLVLVPVAGALLLVAGIGLLWQHADQQQANRDALVTSLGSAPGGNTQVGARGPGRVDARGPATAGAREAASIAPARPVTPLARQTGRGNAGRAGDRLLFAAGFFGMETVNTLGKATGDSGGLADENIGEPSLPGAPAGDLGDAVAPMPPLRPLVIQPLATPPIPEAPPVSTLGKPVGTLTDDAARDRGPGKSGGTRP